MASKYGYEIVEIPDNATLDQIKNGLNNKGNDGWSISQIITNNKGRFVILEKELVK